MSAFLITYDLNKPGAKYDDLYKLIKAYGTWCHVVDSTWIVVSSGTAQSVYDSLSAALDKGDHIFVVDITGKSSQGWLPREQWDWIRKHV